MLRQLSLVFLVLIVASPARAADEQAKAVKEKLQGTWTAQAASKGGREMPADKLNTLKITFAGDTMSIQEGDRKPEVVTITSIDSSKNPAWIDLSPVKKPEEKSLGVYKLDGDNLEIAFTQSATATDANARPEKVGPGEKIGYLKLSRQK